MCYYTHNSGVRAHRRPWRMVRLCELLEEALEEMVHSLAVGTLLPRELERRLWVWHVHDKGS